MLEKFYETFKTPHESLLDKLWHKSFSMASKRGQKRPNRKMTKKAQYWNLILNIIHEDHKKPKIIQKFKSEEAAMTLKTQHLHLVGLIASLTDFGLWPQLRSDWGLAQTFLLKSMKKGLVNDLKEYFGHLKVHNPWYAIFNSRFDYECRTL